MNYQAQKEYTPTSGAVITKVCEPKKIIDSPEEANDMFREMGKLKKRICKNGNA